MEVGLISCRILGRSFKSAMYSDIPDVDIMLRPSNCCESTGEEGRYGDPLIDRISDWQFRMKTAVVGPVAEAFVV